MATSENDPMLPRLVGFRVSGVYQGVHAADTFELHRVALEHAHRLQGRAGWSGVRLDMVTLLPEYEGGEEHLEPLPLTPEKP
jgi:hypothetical protein